MGTYAGVDWASEEHALLVANERGEVLVEDVFAHDEDGISALCRLLMRLEVDRVAVERPDGLLTERLLDAGLAVIATHPNQVKAARARFRAHGGKSDRFDAFVLAELCRTDAHRFRVLEPDADDTKALRALTRAREELVSARVPLANQLRAELDHFWPGAKRIFADVDSPIALAFLERYPSPVDAHALGEKRLAAFLARHQYSGRRQPAGLLARLHTAPTGRAGGSETEARRQIVLALLAALKPLVARTRELTSEIAHRLRAHQDGEIFTSLFRDPKSVVTAARPLAEIGDRRERYPTAEAFAADAGISAIAIESGKQRRAAFRYACDKRLRDPLATLADSSRHHNPWARRPHTDARARGHDNQPAIRTLGRACCRVLWRTWRDRATYEPTKHRTLMRQITTPG